MPFVELDDAQLFFTDEGTGDATMVFVHGYSCDSHDWSWQIPHFADRYRVVAVDSRGHGRSSAPDDGYDPHELAEDVAALIGHLDCGPVIVVGHSLGGVVASTLAVEHPTLVAAVVSIDPGYLVADGVRELIQPVIDALNDGNPVPVAQQFIAQMHATDSPASLRTWHVRRVAGTPDHVLQQTLTALFDGMMFESVSAPYLARRPCPVLGLYADPSRAALESSLFRDERSAVMTFEGAGHWIHQERPAEVNAAIDTWLASL